MELFSVESIKKNSNVESLSNTESLTAKRKTALRWNKRLFVQRYFRLFARLFRMSVPEIAQRVRVRAINWRRIHAIYFSRYTAKADDCASRFVEAIGAEARKNLASKFDQNFFYGPSQKEKIASQLKQGYPENVERILRSAQALTAKGIKFLGQTVRIVPGVIDWHADPISGKRAWPLSKLDEAAAIRVPDVDVKYVWEINRHQFLPTLGRAFWLTDDSRYAHTACALIKDWIDKNPVGLGVNWCSHLEVAMRGISWLWTMPFLLSWEELDEDFLQLWLRSIAQHYYHLSKNLSKFTDPTNHLIGETTALWMLSLCFSELPDADKQVERSLGILLGELERQTTPDGVNKEQATSYHRFVLDFYLQIVALSHRVGEPIPATAKQRIEAMLDFAAALAGKHGRAPMIGDSDDARAIPMPELVGWDFRDLLPTGAVLFSRSDWKYRSETGIAEPTIWLLGPAAIDKYTELTARTPAQTSRVLAEGGYCFFRTFHPEGDAELIFDVGSFGLWPNASHGHADNLNILIRVNGKFLLTDPGTGTYFGSQRVRDDFRRTSAHNTLTVDQFDQADIYGTFKWVNPMQVKLLGWFINDEFGFATAMHDGYSRLREPVMHYRSVLSLKVSEWVVIDYLEGRGEHLFTRYFHFPPGTQLHRAATTEIIALDPVSGNGLQFIFPELDGVDSTQVVIDNEGLSSPCYGRWVPAPRLRLSTIAKPPLILSVMISPFYSIVDCRINLEAFNVSASPLLQGQARLYRKISDSANKTEDMILVNPNCRDVALPGGLWSDARFLFLRRCSDATIAQAFVEGEERAVAGTAFKLSCQAGDRFAAYTKTESSQANGVKVSL